MTAAAQTTTPSAPTDAELAAMMNRSNRAVTRELDVTLELLEGAVPGALRGVLLRNGPGRLEINGQRYGHLFDGDGHINRFAFTDQGIRYRNRYVRTREYLAEQAAGKILYRNFGTNIPGGARKNFMRMRFKNAANTSVVYHARALYALWEGGWPHRLDPVSLETLARDDLGGALRNRGPLLERLLAPELPFSAHPRRDPETGALYNFGVAAGKDTKLCLYRVDADGVCAPPRFLPLATQSFIHDAALTERYRIFFATPTAFDIPRTMLGLATPVDTLRQLPGPTMILVVDRDDPRHVRRFRARPGFIFHFPNAYEDGHRLIVDGFRMEGSPTASGVDLEADTLPRPELTRYVIDTRSLAVEERALSEYPGELATINPRRAGRRYRYAWAMGSPKERAVTIPTAVLKYDTQTPSTLIRDFRREIPGEPLFVPRPGGQAEDDGWLLVQVYVDAQRTCDLLVLNARDLSTVARARMPHSTPLGFHGTWVDAAELAW